jgi:hypothetical protein
VEIALMILLGIVTLICLLGGLNLMLKGTRSYLAADIPPQPVLDNLFRFQSGIYLSLGFLLTWVLFHLSETHELIYFIGLVVIFSGLGRLYSRISVAPAGKYYDTMMVLEIVIGVAIMIMEMGR